MSIFRKDLKIKKRLEVVLDKSSEEETEQEELEKDVGDSLHDKDKVQAEHLIEIEKRKKGEENFASSQKC